MRKLGDYNLTEDQFDSLLEEQDGRCAICQKAFTKEIFPVIDHDHKCCPNKTTGARLATRCGKCVRGLLCTKCNVGLGMFDDDIERLVTATKYLDAYNPREYLIELESLEVVDFHYKME